MSTSPVRLGLVGCGRLAEQGYVPAASAAAGVELVAVADPDEHRRHEVARLASRPGAEVDAFPTAAELLAGTALDAVVLASPARHHVADAERAIAAGLPVLVEKPPAPDAAGAAALVALGPLVHVGFNRRFDPDVRAVHDAVPLQGRLELELEIRYRRASWAAHTVRDEVLVDLVPHLVDLARWLTGSEVTAVAAERLTPERAELALTLDRGRAVVRAAADQLHLERFEVRSERGPVARHRTGGPVAAVTGRLAAVAARARGTEQPHPLVESLRGQLDAFASAVRGEPHDLLGTTGDGHAVMAAIDAARASAARGGTPVPPVKLPERPLC
jgi:predicted dehydrogenase